MGRNLSPPASHSEKPIEPPWFHRRGYPHFDRPISLEKAAALVTDPQQVSRWSFYPLLRYIMSGDRARGAEMRYAKRRPISYAAHRDAHLYSYYSHILSERYESLLLTEALDPNVIAFRRKSAAKSKCTIDHALDAFTFIRSLSVREPCVALGYDVSGFFDNLDHGLLKAKWCELLGARRLPEDHYQVYRSVTKFSWVDRSAALNELRISKGMARKLRPDTPICTASDFRSIIRGRRLIKTNLEHRGIPQGTPISALLSNVYMLDFDRSVQREVALRNGRYWRYCDDILVVLPMSSYSGISAIVDTLINKEKLSINQDKTESVYFSGSAVGSGKITAIHVERDASGQARPAKLQYLGFTYDGERVLIREKSLRKQSRRMNKAVNLAETTKNKQDLIRQADGLPIRGLYRRKLYEVYSSDGQENFHTYGLRAQGKMSAIDPFGIHRQLRNRDKALRRSIRAIQSEE